MSTNKIYFLNFRMYSTVNTDTITDNGGGGEGVTLALTSIPAIDAFLTNG
jgi:hypothetical protein